MHRHRGKGENKETILSRCSFEHGRTCARACTRLYVRDTRPGTTGILRETEKNYDSVNLEQLFESETWKNARRQTFIVICVYFRYLRHAPVKNRSVRFVVAFGYD